jgi:hypothetical protein
MIRPLIAILLLASPALADTNNPIANSITNTSAGQATGTVLNSNTQLNQMPVMQQEFGAGYRCQSSTLSISPYYVGSASAYNDFGSASGFGGMLTISVPLDGRGVEYCMRLAAARVDKEEFDLKMTRTLKCAELLRAGFIFTTPDTQQMCAGIAFAPQANTVSNAPLASPQTRPQEVILTR